MRVRIKKYVPKFFPKKLSISKNVLTNFPKKKHWKCWKMYRQIYQKTANFENSFENIFNKKEILNIWFWIF